MKMLGMVTPGKGWQSQHWDDRSLDEGCQAIRWVVPTRVSSPPDFSSISIPHRLQFLCQRWQTPEACVNLLGTKSEQAAFRPPQLESHVSEGQGGALLSSKLISSGCPSRGSWRLRNMLVRGRTGPSAVFYTRPGLPPQRQGLLQWAKGPLWKLLKSACSSDSLIRAASTMTSVWEIQEIRLHSIALRSARCLELLTISPPFSATTTWSSHLYAT